MAGQKTISSTYTPPPAPPPDIVVTGTPTPTPDCRGSYFQGEDIGGFPAYHTENNLFQIRFVSIPNKWMLVALEVTPNAPFWLSPTSSIDGVYVPDIYATGNPTVTSV